MIGIGIGIDSIRRGGASDAIAALLPGASLLVQFDNSDLSTMFQDRAGTVPVTAAGQNVGYQTAKGSPGVFRTAINDTTRGVYAVHPVGGRRNLLTYSENFGNAVWAKRSSAGSGTTVTDTAVNSDHSTLQTFAAAIGDITASVKLKAGSIGFAWVTISTVFGLGNYATAIINLSTGVITKTQRGGTVSIVSSSVSPQDADGFWTLNLTVTQPATSVTVIVGGAISATPAISSYGSIDYLGTGTGTFQAKAQVANGTATAYQKVTSQYDVTEAGQPSLSHIVFDGLNTAYATGTVTPGADRVQVFWAGRKLADSTSILMELGSDSGSNGGFYLVCEPTDARYGYAGRGARAGEANDQTNVNGFGAPDTAILTAIHGINAGVPARLRRNGGAYFNSVNTTFGGGNFQPLPVYYGRRAGTSLPFNGREYNSILRFSTADLSDNLIAQTEGYLAGKSGVTI